MQRYQIWVEGYACTGDSAKAHLICTCEGKSFLDACQRASLKGKFKGYGNFNEENLTLWGCRLYDNEADARRYFG